MADEIRLVTYANQQVTPQNDAVLTNLETPNNGIIFGCEISIKNASTLHINSGMGVIYGREFEIVDSDISVPLPGAGTELGQLYIHIDLANTSAPVQLLIETGASLTPMVDDANLNVTTGITEYQLATFNVSTATISDLVVTFENTKDIRSELGTADISGIGDGSVKSAISQINSDLSAKLPQIVWANPSIQSGTSNSFIIADLFVVNAVYDLSSSRPLGSICKFQLNGTDVNISGTYYGYARNTSTGDIYSIYTNPNDAFLKSSADMPAGTYNLTLIAKVSV